MMVIGHCQIQNHTATKAFLPTHDDVTH